MLTRHSAADYARHAALLAAMLISFATQQHLAVTHGVPQLPSYAVPLAIDLYLVWAVRSRRDVALAVLVSVAANVAGVLTAEPLGSVDTWVSAGLHAVFPLTLWRMHRPWVTAETPVVAEPVTVDRAPEIAAPAPAEPLPDRWPDADLWADFEDSAPDTEPVTPPSAADVRTVMSSLAAKHDRPVTGAMLADYYRVSERTGRRYRDLATA
ncbi:transfer protein spdA [Streptomyces sp. NBC_01361]|uniref:transfer protein spdA n=1 Tax=Streptomyces sp. NBC_01361 TaxID=2903838 RepID=UPI002E308245|nr:transfer protein spdA [Streptomyces sp. NBC_01361]